MKLDKVSPLSMKMDS